MTVDIKSSKNDYALSCTKHIAGKNSAGAGVTQTMGRGYFMNSPYPNKWLAGCLTIMWSAGQCLGPASAPGQVDKLALLWCEAQMLLFRFASSGLKVT